MSNNSEVTVMLTGDRMFAAHTGGWPRPSPEEIALLAYSFYEMRGCQNGHDLDDWLAAEVQLTHHYE